MAKRVIFRRGTFSLHLAGGVQGTPGFGASYFGRGLLDGETLSRIRLTYTAFEVAPQYGMEEYGQVHTWGIILGTSGSQIPLGGGVILLPNEPWLAVEYFHFSSVSQTGGAIQAPRDSGYRDLKAQRHNATGATLFPWMIAEANTDVTGASCTITVAYTMVILKAAGT